MSAWSDGYNANIGYTHGYYRELSPDYLAFVCLLNGVRPPGTDRPFRYLELGCGQGLTLNILAAGYTASRFVGIDFNPLHVAGARRLAEDAGLTNVEFREDSFQDYAARLARDGIGGGEEPFDFIVLHGVYSWISRENRRAVVDILAHALKPGGLAYVSYNSLPGWGALVPLQKLMLAYGAAHPGRSDRQLDGALSLLAQLRDGGARYFEVNAGTGPHVEALISQDRHYLAHEYLNSHWEPLGGAEVATGLQRAKLDYACSANIPANIDELSIPEALRPAIAAITDPMLAETARDFTVNQNFRRDIFIRGLERLRPDDMQAELRRRRVTLTIAREDASLAVPIPLGEIRHEEELGAPILNALAAGTPRLGEIEAAPVLAAYSFASITRFVALQVAAGRAHPLSTMATTGAPAGTVVVTAESKAAAERLNRLVTRRAVDDTLSFFAAPGVGGGAPANVVDRLVLAGLFAGQPAEPQALAAFAADALSAAGRHVFSADGAAIQDSAGMRVRLAEVLTATLPPKLGIWSRIGII